MRDDQTFQEICQSIKEERGTYQPSHKGTNKFFDVLSLLFLLAGFGALIAIFFTDVTIVEATCLFVISYVVAPTDGDRYESMVKGIAEDVGFTRAHLEFLNTKK